MRCTPEVSDEPRTRVVSQLLAVLMMSGVVVCSCGGNGSASNGGGTPSAEEAVGTEHFLADMNPVGGTSAPESGNESVNGVRYPRSVAWMLCNADDTEMTEYDLGRDYRRFRAVLGLSDDSTSGSVERFELSVDGRVAFQRGITLGESQTIDMNVTGVLRLRVVATAVKIGPMGGCDRVVLGSAQLTTD